MTSWSYCSREKWRIDYLNDYSHRFETLRGIFVRLFMRHTQFFQVESVSKAILEVSREIFSTFCALFLLLNNTMQAKIWSVFKVGEQVSIIFFDLQIFSKF